MSEEISGIDVQSSYTVLVNDEGQHSLWPARKAVPLGWRAVGPIGTEQECIEYVEREWTDITPLSVRGRLQS